MNTAATAGRYTHRDTHSMHTKDSIHGLRTKRKVHVSVHTVTVNQTIRFAPPPPLAVVVECPHLVLCHFHEALRFKQLAASLTFLKHRQLPPLGYICYPRLVKQFTASVANLSLETRSMFSTMGSCFLKAVWTKEGFSFLAGNHQLYWMILPLRANYANNSFISWIIHGGSLLLDTVALATYVIQLKHLC